MPSGSTSSPGSVSSLSRPVNGLPSTPAISLSHPCLSRPYKGKAVQAAFPRARPLHYSAFNEGHGHPCLSGPYKGKAVQATFQGQGHSITVPSRKVMATRPIEIHWEMSQPIRMQTLKVMVSSSRFLEPFWHRIEKYVKGDLSANGRAGQLGHGVFKPVSSSSLHRN